MSSDKIPKTWEWYGEALKWFIAIAAAFLALGLQQATTHDLTRVQWAVVLVSALLLLLSAGSGLFAYMQLLGASNHKEIENPNNAQKRAYEHHLHWAGWLYKSCIGFLIVGIATTTVAALLVVWPTFDKSTLADGPVEIVSADGKVDSAAFIMRRREGKTELLVRDAAGALSWRPVSVPDRTSEVPTE